jgi:hypothetical protein
MDRVLRGGSLSYGEAAYFVLEASETAYGVSGSVDAAFSRAAAKGWLSRKAASGNGGITLGELSFLIMESFKLKSGFLYRIFPGPRYAYRELVWRGFITGVTDPSRPVRGEKFFEIMGNVLDAAGDGR